MRGRQAQAKPYSCAKWGMAIIRRDLHMAQCALLIDALGFEQGQRNHVQAYVLRQLSVMIDIQLAFSSFKK